MHACALVTNLPLQAAVRVSGLELGGLVGSLIAGRASDWLIARSPKGGNVGKRVQVGAGLREGHVGGGSRRAAKCQTETVGLPWEDGGDMANAWRWGGTETRLVTYMCDRVHGSKWGTLGRQWEDAGYVSACRWAL